MTDIVERLRCFSKNTPWAIEDRVVLKEAADEITNLRAERDQLRQYLDAAQRRGEELRAQVAALRVDAERYRWLRDAAWHKGALLGLVERYGPFEWDDAIDEARGAT